MQVRVFASTYVITFFSGRGGRGYRGRGEGEEGEEGKEEEWGKEDKGKNK